PPPPPVTTAPPPRARWSISHARSIAAMQARLIRGRPSGHHGAAWTRRGGAHDGEVVGVRSRRGPALLLARGGLRVERRGIELLLARPRAERYVVRGLRSQPRLPRRSLALVRVHLHRRRPLGRRRGRRVHLPDLDLRAGG